MRVLIADDHAVFRRGVRETLREAFAKATFGEAETAEETLEFVRRSPWDLLILDISMPGKSGLDILEEVIVSRRRESVMLCER
jgi:two-component system, NarL family, invasion response regulator UvrY